MECALLATIEHLVFLLLKQLVETINCPHFCHSDQMTALIIQKQKVQEDLEVQLTMETTG